VPAKQQEISILSAEQEVEDLFMGCQICPVSYDPPFDRLQAHASDMVILRWNVIGHITKEG
jgi:hypothetical protein